MNVPGNYIKLSRRILQWEWYKDSVTKDLFLHLLLKATYKPTEWRGYELQPGQVVTGRRRLAEELGYSERQIRTALNHLETSRQVVLETTNQFTLVTIVNWCFYQGGDIESDQRNDRQSTNKLSQRRPTYRPPQSKAVTAFKSDMRPTKQQTTDRRNDHNTKIKPYEKDHELAATAANLGLTVEEYLQRIADLRR